MNKEELNRYFEQMTPGTVQKERMLQGITSCNKKEVTPLKRMTRRVTIQAAVIILLVMITATSALAVTFNWHVKLMEYFGIQPGQEAMLEEAQTAPDATLTHEGVTVTVKQTLADSKGLYVLYEMSVPKSITLKEASETALSDGTTLEERTDWGFYSLNAPIENLEGDTAMTITGHEILAQSQHHRTGIVSVTPTGKLVDGTIELVFKDLSAERVYRTAEDLKDESTVLVKGEWKLAWDFTYKDSSKIIAPNQNVEGNDVSYRVSEVSISPISSCVTVKAAANAGNLFRFPVHLNLKDGSRITYDRNSKNKRYTCVSKKEGNETVYEYQMYNRFDRLIDPEAVKSISIGDTTVLIE
ncbi:DUF4179 domain-containing protein [Aminipila butyrica]|uniref:DUF4179 domain-containing protein n=1 Tax=Aminipila butyrica TaxID=433296 RepID=A0A858BWA2_9FIRM|nr:DUF4179 domain-containing protein [Aminipila butyrica]QIB69180.1 DUF4179 domain-containing protein [Aminipila butyrica]